MLESTGLITDIESRYATDLPLPLYEVSTYTFIMAPAPSTSLVDAAKGWDLARLVGLTLVVPSSILARLATLGVSSDDLDSLRGGNWIQMKPALVKTLVAQLNAAH